MEAPQWWIYISGAFFAINVVFFASLVFVMFKLLGVMNDLKPKVESLTTKVEALTDKVSEVATKVDDVATSVKETVEVVGGRTRSLATKTGDSLERFAPMVTGILTAIKIAGAIKQARGTHESKDRAAKNTRKKSR